MNKSVTIIVVVIVLIVLGGGLFYLLGHHSNPSQSQSQQSTAMPQSQTQQMSTQKKSLFDFFSMTGSQKCTFSNSTNNSSGTVYIGGGKMRGDFQSSDNGTTNSSHMVNDGTYVYFWSDGKTTGYKLSLAAMKEEQAKATMTPGSNPTAQSSQAVNMKQQSNYSCGPWSADASMFTVPTNITFTDYSSFMQGGAGAAAQPGSAAGGNNSAECAACNQAPAGAARNQCLAALKCQ
jgi:uncharacterized protein YxeA